MNTTQYENETRALDMSELDAVAGGAPILDTVVQAVKTVAQIITGTTGVCTNHWYSD